MADGGTAHKLLERAASEAKQAPDLDRALARIAGVLHPSFYLRRVALSMPVSEAELKIVGLWTDRPTRLGKGATLRMTTTSFPEVVSGGAVTFSSESHEVTSEVLAGEGITHWASIPVPTPERVEAILTLCAGIDVFTKQKEFLTAVGLALGERLIALAGPSSVDPEDGSA